MTTALDLYVPGPAPVAWVLELLAVLSLKILYHVLGILDLGVAFTLHFLFETQIGWWVVVVPFCFYYEVVLFMWMWRAFFKLCRLLWMSGVRHTIPGWLLELCLAYVLRGRKALPPVLGVEDVEGTRMAQPGETQWYSRAIAEGNNLAHASVSAGGLTPARTRRRARWVNALESYLGGRPGVVGKLMRGRWEPDLPSSQRTDHANVLLSLLDCESKLLGGGAVSARGNRGDGIYFVIETPQGREVVFPHLLGRLARFSALRCRDSALWTGLRTRAQEWVKSAGIREDIAALILPTHVARAFLHSTTEKLATSLAESHGYNATALCAGL